MPTTLYALVKETGLENVQVVLSGVTKGGEGARVASPSNRDQDVYPPWFDRGNITSSSGHRSGVACSGGAGSRTVLRAITSLAMRRATRLLTICSAWRP